MIETRKIEENNINDEIDFIETNAEVILANLISDFEEFIGEKLYEGDEKRMYLQGFAYALTDTLIHINETGRENLLRYAIDGKLDALGDLYGNKRLEPQYAKTTIKFSLSTSPRNDVIITKGSRVTPDGMLFFATDEDIIFPTNTPNLSKEVGATATETGSEYNNFAIGDINILVDGNMFVSKVENTTESAGGSDLETDEEYRERLRLSPFSFSVAGPANAYKMIALSVSNDVGDVAVYSPSAGVVEIAIVKDGGTIPTESDELISEILEACSDKDKRPLTDKVQVVPATASETSVNVTYYVANNDLSNIQDITNAIEEYKKWQTEKIGRDINPNMLVKMMMDAGAYKVDVVTPVYVKLERNEIAQFTDTKSTFGGSITV